RDRLPAALERGDRHVDRAGQRELPPAIEMDRDYDVLEDADLELAAREEREHTVDAGPEAAREERREVVDDALGGILDEMLEVGRPAAQVEDACAAVEDVGEPGVRRDVDATVAVR